MVDHLIIKNFGPIKDANIELKPLLLLIGGQGTGKSTVAKVLSICRDVVWYNYILKDENVLFPFFELGIHEYFQDDSYIEYQEQAIAIVYKEGKFSIKMEGVADEKMKSVISEVMYESAVKVLGNKGELTSEMIKNNFNLLRANSRLSLYIPAERNIVGNLSNVLASMMAARIPISNTIIEYMGLFEKAKKLYPVYSVPFLQLSFSKTDKEESVVINADRQEKKISLQSCSSGIQSVLPLLMVLDYSLETGNFIGFIIEEPEQNLFPTNQMELLRFLIQRMNASKSIENLILTTHSPYLLSVLNISILAAIIAKDPAFSAQVDALLPADMRIAPERIAVYSLGNDGEEYCKSVMNKETGTIEQNYLDGVSDVLGAEFNQLYKLYIKTISKA